jgi:LysR family transcriptional regulator, mexEF-oprN operon transcriptional activator
MAAMYENYARDLDLNLIRVFVVVAEHRSVTQAAARLYLTQPAVSAALRRLTTAVGAPLFVRQGRGLALTQRGEQLLARARLHLAALVDAALAPAAFDPRTSERTLRLGLADAAEMWLLPELLRVFEREAPRLRVIAIPVNFRTVAEAIATQRLDAAITVADELPATIRREPLYRGGFVCLFDPRHARVRRLTEAAYFAHDHVVVSYNGDLRGIVEDMLHKQRRVRCAVPSFASLGALIDGSALLATVPEIVARYLQRIRPHLRTRPLPFDLSGAASELLWPSAVEDDEPCRFVRDRIRAIARAATPPAARRARRSGRTARATS